MLRKLRVFKGRPGRDHTSSPADLRRDLLDGEQERVFLGPCERALDVLPAEHLLAER